MIDALHTPCRSRRKRNSSLEYSNCHLDEVAVVAVVVVVAADVVAVVVAAAANCSFEQVGFLARTQRWSCKATTTLKQQQQIG